LGAGGSGIVIVRYLGSAQFTGGTVTSSGGYTIHTFTSNGTLAHIDVTPGSVTYSTAGDFTWTVVPFNTLTVEVWGAGGAGGDSDLQYTTGGGGGGGSYTRWSIPAGTLNATEAIHVGSGGYSIGRSPPYGSDDYTHRAGENSIFGGHAWAAGGYGGYDHSGDAGPFSPASYTPPTTRAWTQTYSETGGNGGVIGNWNGTSTTYAGAGGGAWKSVSNTKGSGGTSTYGGNGGSGDVQNPGAAPGGGSGATNSGFYPYQCAPGGTGRVKITWT
jgi:hypothetical protein